MFHACPFVVSWPSARCLFSAFWRIHVFAPFVSAPLVSAPLVSALLFSAPFDDSIFAPEATHRSSCCPIFAPGIVPIQLMEHDEVAVVEVVAVVYVVAVVRVAAVDAAVSPTFSVSYSCRYSR